MQNIDLRSKIINSFQIAFELFKSSLKNKYSSLQLSIIWDFFDPVLYACVFIFLKSNQSIGFQSEEIPYSLFVISGLMVWQSYVDSLTTPLHLLRGHSNIIKSRTISPITLIFIGYLNILFNHSIRLSILVLTSIYFGYNLMDSLIVILLTIPGLLFFGGLGFLLGPFTFMLSDLEKFITYMIRPLMFVSGVIFPINIELVKLFNPFSIFIDFSRLGLISNEKFNLLFISGLFFFSFFLFIIGTTVYRRSFKLLCDRL